MQPLKQLSQTLRALAGPEHCVFAPSDLAAAVPGCGQLTVLLSRATKAGLLRRVCRGIYFYPVPGYPAGSLLFHAAARLRSRVQGLKSEPEMREDFVKETRRFLPAATVRDTVGTEAYWGYLIQVLDEQTTRAIAAVR